jgi:hypothetical protein
MLTFSLNTFIKICLLDTGGRIQEIQKKLESSGGYDFYNSFQRATREKISGASDTDVAAILNAPSKEVERKYNTEAYNSVQNKFGSIRSLESLSKKKKLTFLQADIEITVDPMFQLGKSGNLLSYSVWPTLKPELTQKYGAVACYIMREAYKGTGLSNSMFHYYDTTKDKSYSEKQITNNTSLIVNADINSISTMIKEL